MTTQVELNSIEESFKEVNEYQEKITKTFLDTIKRVEFIANNINKDTLLEFEEKTINSENELMTFLKLLFDLKSKCIKEDMFLNVKNIDNEIKIYSEYLKQLKFTRDCMNVKKTLCQL